MKWKMKWRTGEEQRAIEAQCLHIIEAMHITDSQLRFDLYMMGTSFLQRERLQSNDLTALRILAGRTPEAHRPRILVKGDFDECHIELWTVTDFTQYWFPIDGNIVERLISHGLLEVAPSIEYPDCACYKPLPKVNRTRVQALARRLRREERIGWENVPDTF